MRIIIIVIGIISRRVIKAFINIYIYLVVLILTVLFIAYFFGFISCCFVKWRIVFVPYIYRGAWHIFLILELLLFYVFRWCRYSNLKTSHVLSYFFFYCHNIEIFDFIFIVFSTIRVLIFNYLLSIIVFKLQQCSITFKFVVEPTSTFQIFFWRKFSWVSIL